MKMQLALPGDTSPAREVERARLVREAIGPDIDLMCDINQRWSVHQAIDIGRRLEDVHFYWLEDVTAHDDYPGLARVADALATPVAGGEYVYGIAPFRHMLEARSVDIVMIDLLRVGGIANWMKVAGMARGVQPAGGEPPVARDPRASGRRRAQRPHRRIHAVVAEVVRGSAGAGQGELTVPARPGLGLKFDREVIKRYVVT